MTSDSITETAKHVGDVLSVGVLLGTISDMLPSVAALMTIVWTGIRIWETSTVRRLTGRADGG
tara:strand:- start:835 stop:1023 length:189 start_codon:yes stop_codon:yes gene_type:complete